MHLESVFEEPAVISAMAGRKRFRSSERMTGHPEVGLFRVNLTRNAHPVLFENSVRPRQQGRNADSSLMWIGSGLQTML